MKPFSLKLSQQLHGKSKRVKSSNSKSKSKSKSTSTSSSASEDTSNFKAVQQLLQELNESNTDTYVRFVRVVHGKTVPYENLVMFDGKGKLFVVDEHDRKCIDIHVKTTWDNQHVHLNDYYFEHKGDCRKNLPHEDFFVLLDFFSYVYGIDLSLTDSSSQQLQCYKVDNKLLRLAKGKTFYNRFGFMNPKFHEILENIAKTPASEFLSQEKVEYAEEEFGISRSTTMHELATLILKHIPNYCKKVNNLYTREYYPLLHLQNEIQTKVNDEFAKVYADAKNHLEHGDLNDFRKHKSSKISFPKVFMRKTGEEKPAYVVTFYDATKTK